MNEHITHIQRHSRLGLWTSVATVIAAGLFLWLSPRQFVQNAYTCQWMLVAGALLAIGTVSMALLAIRKRIPHLRQSEGLDTKLGGYASHVRHLYRSLAASIIILCLMAVVSGQSILLILAIVTTMILILSYPNIYKLKADLGLTDQEMRHLFGEKYFDNDSQ